MSAPPALIVQSPVYWLNDWLPAGVGLPMSAQVQGAGQGSAALSTVMTPTVVTLAVMSSPWPAPGNGNMACPLASVTALPVAPASGPAITAKFTTAFGRPSPLPPSSVAISVTCWPTVAWLRVRVASVVPGAPIARHWMDSFFLGGQKPVSMPPVSRTWVLSVRVVETPPTLIVTVGATVTGVQLLPG